MLKHGIVRNLQGHCRFNFMHGLIGAIKPVVELNLRPPAMLHGKKGFERIVWAFKHVLSNSVSWLFCDLASKTPTLREGQPVSLHPRLILCSTTVKADVYL
jgi:hypothetical protein